jgi:hypothetical protein
VKPHVQAPKLCLDSALIHRRRSKFISGTPRNKLEWEHNLH